MEIDLATAVCKYCKAEFEYYPTNRAQPMAQRKQRAKLTKRNVCDLCRDSTARRDRCVKLGPEFADETQHEREYRQVKENLKNYVFGLSIVQPTAVESAFASAWEQAWDVE